MPLYTFISLSINYFLNSSAKLTSNYCAATSIGNKCMFILHGFNHLIMSMLLLLSGDIVPHPQQNLSMSAFAFGYKNGSLVTRNSFERTNNSFTKSTMACSTSWRDKRSSSFKISWNCRRGASKESDAISRQSTQKIRVYETI